MPENKIIAEWIEKETGDIVKEYGYGVVGRFEGRIVKFTSRLDRITENAKPIYNHPY